VLKRLLDIGAASAGLALSAPLMALVALAIWRDMGRPVLFRQARPGKGGKIFHVYKFRSMRDALGPDGEPLPDAERITNLGTFLRRSSLDELPNLLNVLLGHMSLVGPRPLLPEYLDLYTPRQARRHDVEPGLTSWAVVNGDHSTSWEERFELDVYYVEHQSLALDLEILLKTALLAIRGREAGAEGFVGSPRFTGSPA
jgi:sugar transferase EpsL